MTQVSRPIKVVRIFSRLNIGGPSIHVCLLSHYLKGEYETILVTGQVGADEGDMSYLFSKYNGFRHVYIPELGRNIHVWKDLVAFWKIFRLLMKEKPQIVHTHTAKAGLLGRLAAVLARVPIRFHTFHGHVFENYFGSLKSQLIIWVERCLAQVSTQIIAISPKQKKELVERFHIASAKRVQLIPLGFDFEGWEREIDDTTVTRHQLAIPLDKFVIGIVGRLVPIKNHAFFLKIAKRMVQNKRADIHFLIVGDGELKTEINRMIREAGLLSHFTVLGWQKELKPIYEMMDVLCLTSLNEGTPVSLIEAQAAGLPIVTSAVGGVEDIVLSGQNGYVISGWNEDEFVQRILMILDDEDFRNRIKKNQKWEILKKYSKEQLLMNVGSLYLTHIKSVENKKA